MTSERTSYPMRLWRDVLPVGAVVLATVTLFSVALSRTLIDDRLANPTPKSTILSVASAAVIKQGADWIGDANAAYTLVEFADYQCPPCRIATQRLPMMLARYRGKLRLMFRNLPLPDLHEHALAAAAAEAARQQGRFWSMHDALYAHQDDLSPQAIRSLATNLHLNVKLFDCACATSAKLAVNEDIACANLLRVSATPTFILCCPDNRIVQLGTLDQLDDYIKP